MAQSAWNLKIIKGEKMKKLGAFVMSVVVTGMLSGCFDSTPIV